MTSEEEIEGKILETICAFEEISKYPENFSGAISSLAGLCESLSFFEENDKLSNKNKEAIKKLSEIIENVNLKEIEPSEFHEILKNDGQDFLKLLWEIKLNDTSIHGLIGVVCGFPQRCQKTLHDIQKKINDEKRKKQQAAKKAAEEAEKKMKELEQKRIEDLFYELSTIGVAHGRFKKGDTGEWGRHIENIKDPKSKASQLFEALTKKVKILSPQQLTRLAGYLEASTICYLPLLTEFIKRCVTIEKLNIFELLNYTKLFANQRIRDPGVIRWIFGFASNVFESQDVLNFSNSNLYEPLKEFVRSLAIIKNTNPDNLEVLGDIQSFTVGAFLGFLTKDSVCKQIAQPQHKELKNACRQFCSQLTISEYASYSEKQSTRQYLPLCEEGGDKNLYDPKKESEFAEKVFKRLHTELFSDLKVPILGKKGGVCSFSSTEEEGYSIQMELSVSPYKYDIVISRKGRRHLIEIQGNPYHFLVLKGEDGKVCGDHLNGASFAKLLYPEYLNYVKENKNKFFGNSNIANYDYSFSDIKGSIWSKTENNSVEIKKYFQNIIPSYFWKKNLNDSSVKSAKVQESFCDCERQKCKGIQDADPSMDFNDFPFEKLKNKNHPELFMAAVQPKNDEKLDFKQGVPVKRPNQSDEKDPPKNEILKPPAPDLITNRRTCMNRGINFYERSEDTSDPEQQKRYLQQALKDYKNALEIHQRIEEDPACLKQDKGHDEVSKDLQAQLQKIQEKIQAMDKLGSAVKLGQ